MALIRFPSKNICSVLVSPIPTAPKSLAFLASFGVSALVLTFIVAYLLAISIISPKSPLNSGSIVASLPSYNSPVEPFNETQVPSPKV